MPAPTKAKSALPSFSLNDIVASFIGLEVPDPITFVVGAQWLNRPNLYPRQATLLKIIFLRDDLFTSYDLDVIAQWTGNFTRTAYNGIQPDVLERIKILKAEGRKWFREVLLVMGRRAGKGHLSGLAMAYVLWHYMAKGDPQDFYGVDRSKRLTALIFAGKREQAKANLWKDLVNVVTDAPCFAPYVSKYQAESLTVFAPADFVKIRRQAERGISSELDQATFEILPKESTLMAGRGPASFCLDPAVPVLTTDLRWVPIGEVEVGDHLVGVDEYPDGGQRKMRDAEVLATWRTRKPALRLTFADGSEVVCSHDHQWLARDMGRGGATHWRKAGRLKVGNHIKHLVDPWEEDHTWEGGYLAITSIESLPEQELVDITTSTHTFIANGLVSHNCQGYDEMAHVVASGANRSAEEVYAAATPSLDQFGKDGFIVEPSSPWQMMGQFYDNYTQALAQDEATRRPTYPEKLMVQLASWDIYEDWERAHLIPLFNGTEECFQPLRGAIQTYDEQMIRLKMGNPETFAVERESKFATAIDAYLNAGKVEEMFRDWNGRTLYMQERGLLMHTYKGHADPSKSNANFGFALAHPEVDAEGNVHAVFDLIHHFDPAEYPDHVVNYEEIEDWIWDKIVKFTPDEMTFDQWNSASTIERLQKRVRGHELPKRVNVYEQTATRSHNWKRAENFKTALNMGWVHAPYYEQAELELKFLQERNGSVEKPTMGPVQTKDVADCMMECVYTLIGEQVNAFIAGDLSRMRPSGALGGGIDPFPGMRDGDDPRDMMAAFGRSRSGGRETGYGRAPSGHRMRGGRHRA